MDAMLERVKDELCGNFIVVTGISSGDSEKVSPEDLEKIFTLLVDHCFIYADGIIYIATI